MRFEIPIFRQIALDLERTAREQLVFYAAVELLDIVEERPMTLTALETTMFRLLSATVATGEPRPSRSTISAALTQLEEAGYLCRREADDGRAMWRVPLSRRPCAAKPTPNAKAGRTSTRKTTAGVISEVI